MPSRTQDTSIVLIFESFHEQKTSHDWVMTPSSRLPESILNPGHTARAARVVGGVEAAGEEQSALHPRRLAIVNVR